LVATLTIPDEVILPHASQAVFF
jgi:hypothetical protein